MNGYKMREFWTKLIESYTPEELERVFNQKGDISESYGKIEHLAKESAEGRKVEANYCGENVSYWVPSDGAWINGKGLSVTQAYKIVNENDSSMELREVQSPSEIEAIARGCKSQMRRILERE